MFARFDAQAEVIECDVVASNDAHVFQVHQSRSHEVRFSPRFIIISPHVFPLLESSGGFTSITTSISYVLLEAIS